MHPFSFLQHFDPFHIPLQSSLKLHLAMNSLSSLPLKLHLELSFLPSACITLHTSLLPRLLSPWLIMTMPFTLGSDILLRRASLWILDCTVPPEHTAPPLDHAAVEHLPPIFGTVPPHDDVEAQHSPSWRGRRPGPAGTIS